MRCVSRLAGSYSVTCTVMCVYVYVCMCVRACVCACVCVCVCVRVVQVGKDLTAAKKCGHARQISLAIIL